MYIVLTRSVGEALFTYQIVGNDSTMSTVTAMGHSI